MSNILKGLNESYSRDEENQQNAMDTRRRSDLSGERNAGLNEPDELPTTPQQSRNGVYEYNVPTGQEKIAQELGLQLHKGHWFSRVPVQRANFQFGRPQFHEIPSKNVSEAEQDYGPEYQDKVQRLGQMAKQGERKTVWDPVKRVYKTVPVNPPKEQGVAEGRYDSGDYYNARQGYEYGARSPSVDSGGYKFDKEVQRNEPGGDRGRPKNIKGVSKSLPADAFGRTTGKIPKGKPGTVHSMMRDIDEELDENLNKWFKEKWVRFGPDGKIRGDCARGDDSEGKPKCLPQSKAQNLGKEGRASAASRKRREDPNPERSGKAINVNTKKKSNEGVAEEQLDELKCWSGYTRVQGVPAGAPGSCKKKTNEEDVAEGVAETLPIDDAVKVLRQYGADHFKTTSNELHFYKQGRPFSVDLVMNPDATRSVTLSSLNSATRGLKGQGVAEGSSGVSVRQWANQVRKDHGPDVKFRNRQEGGGAVDSVIAKNSQGETVGVYNRKTGYPTVYEPKQGVAEVKKNDKNDDHEPFNYDEWKASTVKPRKPRGYKDAEALGKAIDSEQSELRKRQQGVAEGQEESCPHCGGAMFSEMIMNEKKDACYYKVKSRYKVWPSAYASGALVKCRKSGADSWGDGGKKSESAIMRGLVDENRQGDK
jgi:hypothetical protein